jgi:hypothetical protein
MFQPKRLRACAPYPQACGGGQHWIGSCKLKFLRDLVRICLKIYKKNIWKDLLSVWCPSASPPLITLRHLYTHNKILL